jgi:hypothetical protein
LIGFLFLPILKGSISALDVSRSRLNYITLGWDGKRRDGRSPNGGVPDPSEVIDRFLISSRIVFASGSDYIANVVGNRLQFTPYRGCICASARKIYPASSDFTFL